MGQFKKGVSGNPKGRPRGVTDKRQKLRLALEEKAEELLEIIIERAMKGDTQMQRVLLRRLIPPAKPESSLQSFYLIGRYLYRIGRYRYRLAIYI